MPEWTPPRSSAAADALAAELGVSFPPKTKLADKIAALQEVISAPPPAAPAGPSLADLSEEELIDLAVGCGHSEAEVVELSKSELVLFVAEAMGRRSADLAGKRQE